MKRYFYNHLTGIWSRNETGEPDYAIHAKAVANPETAWHAYGTFPALLHDIRVNGWPEPVHTGN